MAREKRLIIGFVSDFMIETRIGATVAKLGYEMEWVSSAETFGESDAKDAPGEILNSGQRANLTRYLSEKQPDLLIFDLNNTQIPNALWIATIKSSPATRRIPVLAFGPHVETEALEKTHKAGADGVVTRGKFIEKLPDLINKHVRRIDYGAILADCDAPLSELAVQAIGLFNQGEYYEAHHGLEDAWNEDKSSVRDLYKAVLQVAVAYLQIERQNYRGAAKMFLRVRQYLDPLPAVCRGIDLDQLRAESEAAHAHLLELGAENIADFDKTYLKPIQLIGEREKGEGKRDG